MELQERFSFGFTVQASGPCATSAFFCVEGGGEGRRGGEGRGGEGRGGRGFRVLWNSERIELPSPTHVPFFIWCVRCLPASHSSLHEALRNPTKSSTG